MKALKAIRIGDMVRLAPECDGVFQDFWGKEHPVVALAGTHPFIIPEAAMKEGWYYVVELEVNTIVGVSNYVKVEHIIAWKPQPVVQPQGDAACTPPI